MCRYLVLALVLAAALPAQAEVWQGRYGVAETYNFKLYNADGTLDVDEVDSGTEVSLACDEGAETTASNDFVDEGSFYSITLTAAEMLCERVAVVVAATTTEVFFIQTNGAAGVIHEGTAQAATSTTLQLAASASFADDEIIGATCVITGGSAGVGQSRAITDYVSSTDTATVAAWATTPAGTITYQCHGTAPGSSSGGLDAAGVRAAIGLASANLDTQLADLPTVSEFNARTLTSASYATAATQITMDGKLDTIDSLVDSIKLKTDQLLFDVGSAVRANVEYMNAIEVLGSGTTADPWNGE